MRATSSTAICSRGRCGRPTGTSHAGTPRSCTSRSAASSRSTITDIVSTRPLRERTRRNAELWAACIAGAIPRRAYLDALEAAGWRVEDVRLNDYAFVSERALDACNTYGVESISIAARKPL
jgi:hypothetical protein